ncbi:hypothetical protein GQ53DRAFT_226372 [Thozetella sp. PMI_491]|nr:hypothetical protein GQ53DRAFT_226372 [Thozetella sp. PMI_491]
MNKTSATEIRERSSSHFNTPTPGVSSSSTAASSSELSIFHSRKRSTLKKRSAVPPKSDRSISLHAERYQCPECSYSSRLPKDVEKHKIKHFGLPSTSCYVCPNSWCGKLYPRRDNGLRHTRLHCRHP